MKETELLGKLLPGHPDIFPIIQNIREKYAIPEVRPEDDIAEILLSRDDIDWDAVKQDIEMQVRNIPLFDEKENTYFQTIQKIQSYQFDSPDLACVPDEMKEALKKLFSALMQPHALAVSIIEEKSYKPIAEMIYEYLLTGQTRDVPEEWFGKVFTGNMFGDNVVIAIAGEGTNPKEITKQLKAEMTKTFGEYKLDVTNAHLATAEYLALRLQGNSLKRLVERYEEKHPSEFPTDKNSKEYKKTKERHVEMLDKRLDRLKAFLKKI